MIPRSGKLFLNNYTMKAVIKDEKGLIDELQTDNGGITYMQKLKYTYKRVRNASAMTLLDLKRHCIQPG